METSVLTTIVILYFGLGYLFITELERFGKFQFEVKLWSIIIWIWWFIQGIYITIKELFDSEDKN